MGDTKVNQQNKMEEPKAASGGEPAGRIDLSKPRWDQSTYMGRAKHFINSTNPINLFSLKGHLYFSRKVVEAHQSGEDMPFTEAELWRHQSLVDSAFHPDTGELMFWMGRMSAQVPMNMLITGAMLHFRSNMLHVIFWQWANQTFNAVVNYTNSNMQGQTEDFSADYKKLAKSYFGATTGAVGTALGLNALRPRFPAVFGRLVPFAAVCAANCINIPIIRSREIIEGIPVFTDKQEYIGDSKTAAKTGIVQVVFSRIAMATPSMILPPLIMHRLEQTRFLTRYPHFRVPMTIGLVGFMLTFSTPLCCALFPQQSSISRSRLEPALQKRMEEAGSTSERVYFNKGL